MQASKFILSSYIKRCNPEFIQQADVVLFHFKTIRAQFMRNISGCHCRLIMWAYVNGMHSPYEFSKKCSTSIEIRGGTPYSLKAKIDGIDIGKYSPKISHVFMTAGVAGMIQFSILMVRN